MGVQRLFELIKVKEGMVIFTIFFINEYCKDSLVFYFEKSVKNWWRHMEFIAFAKYQ